MGDILFSSASLLVEWSAEVFLLVGLRILRIYFVDVEVFRLFYVVLKLSTHVAESRPPSYIRVV